MKELSASWLIEGLWDFEYKKYQLLAYLKEVEAYFDQQALYPMLAALVKHQQNLLDVKRKQELSLAKLPSRISKIDLQEMKLYYEQMEFDHENLNLLNEILDFAIPQFNRIIGKGTDLYDDVEAGLTVEPLGIVPIEKNFGYLLIKEKSERMTAVYEYELSLFASADDQYRTLKTTYLNTYPLSISCTVSTVKYKVIKEQAKFGNPATWLVESAYHFPFQATLFPVVKRKLLKELVQAV